VVRSEQETFEALKSCHLPRETQTQAPSQETRFFNKEDSRDAKELGVLYIFQLDSDIKSSSQ
jgi:hypothetical protein